MPRSNDYRNGTGEALGLIETKGLIATIAASRTRIRVFFSIVSSRVQPGPRMPRARPLPPNCALSC